MRKGALRNLSLALCAFILWGCLVGLLLPAEQAGAVIKTVDFSAAVFLAALLPLALSKGKGKGKNRQG